MGKQFVDLLKLKIESDKTYDKYHATRDVSRMEECRIANTTLRGYLIFSALSGKVDVENNFDF